MNSSSASRLFLTLGALAFLPLALSACDTLEDGVVVTAAPPANEVETIPQISDPTIEIWRPGYWSLENGTVFVWVPGRIIPRPARTAVWTPARWVQHTYGWTFEQGHWQ